MRCYLIQFFFPSIYKSFNLFIGSWNRSVKIIFKIYCKNLYNKSFFIYFLFIYAYLPKVCISFLFNHLKSKLAAATKTKNIQRKADLFFSSIKHYNLFICMSFKNVIKASKQHHSISNFTACLQEKTYQIQNGTNLIGTQIKEVNLNQQSSEPTKKESLWQRESPGSFIHRFLLQNICSLNSLSDKKKHDYAQCEGQQFVHSIQVKEEDKSPTLVETQTAKSQYMSSEGETDSDCESMFEFIPELNLQFETVEIIQTQEI